MELATACRLRLVQRDDELTRLGDFEGGADEPLDIGGIVLQPLLLVHQSFMLGFKSHELPIHLMLSDGASDELVGPRPKESEADEC